MYTVFLFSVFHRHRRRSYDDNNDDPAARRPALSPVFAVRHNNYYRRNRFRRGPHGRRISDTRGNILPRLCSRFARILRTRYYRTRLLDAGNNNYYYGDKRRNLMDIRAPGLYYTLCTRR